MKRDIYFQIATYHMKLTYSCLTVEARVSLLNEYTRFVKYLYLTHYFSSDEYNMCVGFAHNVAAIYNLKAVKK